MSDPNNPFAGLLGVPEITGTSCNEQDVAMQETSIKSKESEEVETINNIVENVFHFTINPSAVEGSTDRQLIYLEELADATKPKVHIDLEALEQALFERLLLVNTEACVIPKTSRGFKEHVVQKQVFPYLFSSMQNLQSYDNVTAPFIKVALEQMQGLIFRNAVTALKQPALFEGQNFTEQLVELLKHVDPQSQTFFTDVVKVFMADGKYCIYFCFLIS